MKAAAYRRSGSEHALQNQVLGILAIHGKRCYPFAIPNAGKRSPAMAARMKAEGLTAGIADLCIMLPDGRTGWLELKTRHGGLSKSQRDFADVCRALGHSYAVARSLDDAIDRLKMWGALK
jgi:hypothetical protein